MDELVSAIILYIEVFLNRIIDFKLLKILGEIAIVITVIMILLWIVSYNICNHEKDKYALYELFPSKYQMDKFEVTKLKNRIHKFTILAFISYYIGLPCGIVSIIFLLSKVFGFIV